MMSSIISNKGYDMTMIIFFWYKRCKDRKWSRIIKTDKHDIPNSEQARQKDLEMLYTGDQIDIGDRLAYIFTVLFICIYFSAGLPLMYPIGTICFFVTYWFDKISLTRFFQKSKIFNEQLTIRQSKFFKYSIFFHFFQATFVFSSYSILDSLCFEGTKHFSDEESSHKNVF